MPLFVKTKRKGFPKPLRIRDMFRKGDANAFILGGLGGLAGKEIYDKLHKKKKKKSSFLDSIL